MRHWDVCLIWWKWQFCTTCSLETGQWHWRASICGEVKVSWLFWFCFVRCCLTQCCVLIQHSPSMASRVLVPQGRVFQRPWNCNNSHNTKCVDACLAHQNALSHASYLVTRPSARNVCHRHRGTNVWIIITDFDSAERTEAIVCWRWLLLPRDGVFTQGLVGSLALGWRSLWHLRRAEREFSILHSRSENGFQHYISSLKSTLKQYISSLRGLSNLPWQWLRYYLLLRLS